MNPIIWKDRVVKLEGGSLLLSRKGQHADFDFLPDVVDEATAVAIGSGNPLVSIVQAGVLDENRLLYRLSSGEELVVVGDDFHCKTETPARCVGKADALADGGGRVEQEPDQK